MARNLKELLRTVCAPWQQPDYVHVSAKRYAQLEEVAEWFHQIFDASLAPDPDFKKLANSCAFRVRVGKVAITFSSGSRIA